MTVFKAFSELPSVEAISGPSTVTIKVDGGRDEVQLIFGSRAEAYTFANSVTRALANLVEAENGEVCDICGFNVELLGHSAECPKRVAG